METARIDQPELQLPTEVHVLSESSVSRLNRNFETVDVLVIGGGAAGLACLRRLSSCAQPCRAVLLESQAVLCGRVKNVLAGGPNQVPREGGAEFGYQDLLDALIALGVTPNSEDLITIAPYNSETLGIFDGQKIVRARDVVGTQDLDVIRNRLFLEMRDFGRDISIREFLDEHSPLYRELQANSPAVCKVIENSLLSEYACESLSKMGIVACADQAIEEGTSSHHNTLTGEVFRISGGYSALIQRLADNLDARSRTTVTCVERLESGNYLVTARDANKNEIFYFEAEQVVLAVPVPILSKIELPPDVDPERCIRQSCKGTYAPGNVVKIVFRSDRALLPEGMETVSCLNSPAEVWQHTVSENNYQYTLWLPGPAATEFEMKAEMRDKAGNRLPGKNSEHSIGIGAGNVSKAHIVVRSMLSEMFGHELANSVTRMAILPWSLLTHAGHAYRTCAPTGKRFDQLSHLPYVKLYKGLYLAGADVNLATVPSALESGMAAADAIIRSRIK